jgi:NADPH-dependent glutamate synthase beta subunit-like oxidoreductase
LRLEPRKGKTASLICQRMTLGEFDSGARRKPVPKEGDTFEIAVDQVILAIGQQVDIDGDLRAIGVGVNRRGLIDIMPGRKTGTAGTMIFAGGDAVRGPDTVIGAVADGHHAAEEIDAALRARNGEPAYQPPPPEEIVIPKLPEVEAVAKPRVHMSEAEPAERRKDFREVELGFTSTEALEEAYRCLRCNLKDVETCES